MRISLWFAAASIVALSIARPAARCQQQDQSKAAQPPPGATQTGAQSSAPQQESLGEAARRAREQKREQKNDAPKRARIFDNDNMPATGMISTVGSASEGAPAGDAAASNPSAGDASAAGAAGAAVAAPTDEKAWRQRFAKLRDKLSRDQQDLEVMQRELSVLDVVNYPDPQKTLQQETTRGDINKKTADIEKQKKKIEADKQAISDAEDDLRKSGGDSGWAR